LILHLHLKEDAENPDFILATKRCGEPLSLPLPREPPLPECLDEIDRIDAETRMKRRLRLVVGLAVLTALWAAVF
jgi:hypothetical protein